jgi:repressor LexA
MPKTLTEKQRLVLESISRFLQQEQRPPTHREMAENIGKNTKTIYQHIVALEKKGALERRKGRIHLLDSYRQTTQEIPVAGQVPAGPPNLAVEDRLGFLSIAGMFPNPRNLFALKVRGDSMTGAHICDGDLVIVRRQHDIDSGQIGVAVVQGEATVKRILIHGLALRLVPENPAYEPLDLDAGQDDVWIAGKVVGVFRRMF